MFDTRKYWEKNSVVITSVDNSKLHPFSFHVLFFVTFFLCGTFHRQDFSFLAGIRVQTTIRVRKKFVEFEFSMNIFRSRSLYSIYVLLLLLLLCTCGIVIILFTLADSRIQNSSNMKIIYNIVFLLLSIVYH